MGGRCFGVCLAQIKSEFISAAFYLEKKMDDLLDLNWSSKPTIVQKQEKKDAFANLLPTSGSSQSKPNDNPKLSLLEQRQQTTSWTTKDTLSNLVRPSHTPYTNTSPAIFSPSVSSTNLPVNAPTSFEDLLNPFAANQKKKNNSRNTPINQLQNPEPTVENKDQWNFDLLDIPTTDLIQNNEKTAQQTNNTDLFDLPVVTRETYENDNPLGILSAPIQPKIEEETTDENPLGILAEPVQPKKEETNDENPLGILASTIQPKTEIHMMSQIFGANDEEEDEMLAQLIDMGFSLQQSKFALEVTGSLQPAIDLLMQNSEPAQKTTRSSMHTATEQPANEQMSSRGDNDRLHIQTEKIVGQAQELGGMIYKNASSFLKIGREKVTKAVGDWQEQQRTQRLRQLQEQQRGSVKPKWMADNTEFLDVAKSPVEKFEDDKLVQKQRQQKFRAKILVDDAEEHYISPSRRKGASGGRSTPNGISSASVNTTERMPQKDTTKLQERQFTYKPQESQHIPIPQERQPIPNSQEQRPAMTTPNKIQERTRPVVNAVPDIILQVNQARARGNEKFKLGQFGEAEEAYTRAIDLLPVGHDHQVFLLNNRAMSRLKTGNYKQCIADCDTAIMLSKESGVSSLSEGLTIQWRDQLLKSLHRKAEALENIEKYQEAVTTYEQILVIEGPSQKINQCMSRCRRALNPVVKTKPQKMTLNTQPTAQELDNSKAVAEMRAKAAEQEAEDAEKLSKTDEVNARLVAWKAGKEQNLRALLATLDTLLWHGAQWKGAQMSDLIDIKKCKITYMKAIAKVHPDKLSGIGRAHV